MKRRICNIGLTILITGFFVFLAFTDFSNSYLRLGEVFKDLGKSLKLYFCMLFRQPFYGDWHISNSSSTLIVFRLRFHPIGTNLKST